MFVANAVLFSTLIAFALAKGHTKLCLKCEHVTDPAQCNVFKMCHEHDHSCFTEVRANHGHYVYELDCKAHHECHDVSSPIVGKRAAHGQVACRHCCDTTGCNAHLCGSFLAKNNTTATPAVQNTTLLPDACQDFEDANFKCSDYDHFHLCDAVSGLTYELGHKRCQLHCGFCTAGGKLQDPCQDHEDANFHCADYDKYHLCTADAGLEYELGHKRCQKHCGFCTSGQALTDVTTTKAPSTDATNPPTSLAPNPSQNTTSWNPIGVDVTVNQAQTTANLAQTTANLPQTTANLAQTTANLAQTTQSTCQDYETPNFSCAEWSTHGFCQMTTGQGHEIAKMRCAKYCGFCH